MKKESPFFQHENDLAWKNVGEGVRRQILGYNDDMMLVKVSFEKGAVGDPHTHPHSQLTYVESGIFTFTVDGKTERVVKGDGIYMPPNSLHGCTCEEAGMLIDTFSPMRKDFL